MTHKTISGKPTYSLPAAVGAEAALQQQLPQPLAPVGEGMVPTDADHSSLFQFTSSFKAQIPSQPAYQTSLFTVVYVESPFKRAFKTVMLITHLAQTASKFSEGTTHKTNKQKVFWEVQWQQNPLTEPQEIFKKGIAVSKKQLKVSKPFRCANMLKSPSLKSVKLELHAIARGVVFHHKALKIISPYRTAYFEYHRYLQ